jgi:hypothetical protein
MKLYRMARQESGADAGGQVLVGGEQEVQRGQLSIASHHWISERSSASRAAPSRASSRVPGTGVNGTATSAFG